MKLNNSVALVSGGASGLGEAVVRSIVKNGGQVAILDFDDDRGKALAAELGDAVISCKTDVADETSVAAAVADSMNAFSAINTVVNCAGVGTPRKVIDRDGNPIPIAFFNRVVQINLIGTMNVIRLAAVEMLKNEPDEDGERGVVVNVASAPGSAPGNSL